MEVVTWDMEEYAVGESEVLHADPVPLVFVGIELPLVLAQVQVVEVADVLPLLPRLCWLGRTLVLLIIISQSGVQFGM